MKPQGRSWPGVLLLVVGAGLLVAAGYIAVLALTGADLARYERIAKVDVLDARYELLPWALAALLLGLASLAGWWRERRRAEALSGAKAATRDRLQRELEQAHEGQRRLQAEGQAAVQREQEQRQAEVQREREERKAEVQQERTERASVERRSRSQQDWNRRLREEIARLHREHGFLGDPHDLPRLVLRVAVELLEAEKGLLLARVDDDGDGNLDLMASEGFRHDPGQSALAQRFAGRVMERDQIVREDDQSTLDAEKRSASDEEIFNLVAIPIYVQDRFSGVVVCANRDGGFDEHEDQILLALGDQAGAALENSRLHGQLRGAYVSTVRMLSEAIEVKDPMIRGHSEAVATYVGAVADSLGVDVRRREELVFGSLLHDVGKIGISERILLKPGRLTTEERSIVELHPRIGFRLVEQVAALKPIAPAILHHHERFDGNGYPGGLAGEQIPLEARIICVADSFSAMTEPRPYRESLSMEEACAELERCASTQFDPEVVRLFVEEVRKRPPDELQAGEQSLRDAELEIRREDDAPRFGSRSFAVTDNLTLLYSHRHFHEAAHAEAQRASVQDRPFAVVLSALTDLSRINQDEGYASGDAAIRRVGEAFQTIATEMQGTAARYSGRRLGLLVPGLDESGAAEVAGRLEAAVDGEIAVRVSSASWRPGESGEDVIGRARLGLAPATV